MKKYGLLLLVVVATILGFFWQRSLYLGARPDLLAEPTALPPVPPPVAIRDARTTEPQVQRLRVDATGIQVRVIDADGQPCRHAEVLIASEWGRWGPWLPCADGSIELRVPAPCWLLARAEGNVPRIVGPKDVVWRDAEGQIPDVVEIDLRPPRSILVTVHDTRRQRIQGAGVSATTRDGRDGVLDSLRDIAPEILQFLAPTAQEVEGGYSLNIDPRQSYMCEITKEGYLPEELEVPPSEVDNYSVVLEPFMFAAFEVLKYTDGEPLAIPQPRLSYRLPQELSTAYRPGNAVVQSLTRRLEQRFGEEGLQWCAGRLQRITPEQVTMDYRAENPWNAEVVEGRAIFRSFDRMTAADIQRPLRRMGRSELRNGSLTINFRTDDGEPELRSPWAVASLASDLEGMPLAMRVVRPFPSGPTDGTVRLELPEGRYEIASEGRDERFDTKGFEDFEAKVVTLAADRHVEVEIEVAAAPPAASLEIMVEDENGRALSGWQLLVMRPHVWTTWKAVPEQGDQGAAVEARNLPPGPYRIFVSCLGYALAAKTTVLEAQEHRSWTIVLRASDREPWRLSQEAWVSEINRFSSEYPPSGS